MAELIGPRDEYLPADQMFSALSVPELNHLWSKEVPINGVINMHSGAYERHGKYGANGTFTFQGFTGKEAMALIARAMEAELKGPPDVEPPSWPCTLDHSVTEEDMKEDGWIHGDPDDYVDPESKPDWDTEC